MTTSDDEEARRILDEWEGSAVIAAMAPACNVVAAYARRLEQQVAERDATIETLEVLLRDRDQRWLHVEGGAA